MKHWFPKEWIDTLKNVDSICNQILDTLSESLRRHTLGVMKTAEVLARRYGADPDKAKMAAAFHDAYKEITQEERKKWIQGYGLPIKYLCNPNLAHGKIAALAMEHHWGIEDPDILHAVAYHTTGRRGMSTLEKIIYLADAMEPGRDYPGVGVIRRLAEEHLDQACLWSMERTVDYVKKKTLELDDQSLEAIEWLKERLNQEEKDHE